MRSTSIGVIALTVLCVAALHHHVVVGEENTRPIVGILTQPSSSSLSRFGKKYIAASYVKYVEAAGARVIPVQHDASEHELQYLFNNLNGILFPGGGSSLSNTTHLVNAGRLFFEQAKKAYHTGDYFPVIGHCMGFELLCELSANGNWLLGHVDAENITMQLNFTQRARSSSLFANAPADIMNILGTKPVTMNNHQWGLYPSVYEKTPLLSSFWNVLSTNVDRQGVEFVSTMEAKAYPNIYALQWHSEKPLFEWNPNEVINHDNDAIYSMQYMARRLGENARMSNHKFANVTDETSRLIYQYQPVYTLPYDSSFEQCYFFD